MANIFYNSLALFSLAYGAGHSNKNMISFMMVCAIAFAITAYKKRPIPTNRYRQPSIIKRIKRDLFTKKSIV